MKKFKDLKFDNTFFRLGSKFYSQVMPEGISDPYRICFSESAASLIDLDPEEYFSDSFLAYASGNDVSDSFRPLSMVYSGHQFGGYTPRLGDGRGLLLGEVDADGISWDLYLKGSGPTPHSRMGDGRAVLRSSIREFLCSEAMASLGIPTTRALCLVGSDDEVRREEFETSAMVVRLSRSHVRFGNFEYFYFTDQHEALRSLLDYVIANQYSFCLSESDKYALFFREVVGRTAKLIARWQAFGFAHGVMNTDNMSIVGETFDYGPFAFMDDYDPSFVCNHSDYEGRYAFDKQPSIGLWNSARLGQALTPFVSPDDLNDILAGYEEVYATEYLSLVRSKLGLVLEDEADIELIDSLFSMMKETRVDYSLFFRALSSFSSSSENVHCLQLLESKSASAGVLWRDWMARYKLRLSLETISESERHKQMVSVNPKFILRTYFLQRAIELAQKKDFSEVQKLLQIMQNPFAEQPDYESYAQAPPESGKCMALSCSS